MSRAKKRAPKPDPVGDALVNRVAAVADAVEYIDGAIVDILDSWSMRGTKPDGACLMSALAALQTARDHLSPRTGSLANRGAP